MQKKRKKKYLFFSKLTKTKLIGILYDLWKHGGVNIRREMKGSTWGVGREVMIIICGPDSRRDILFDKIGNDCILVPG